LGEEIKGKNFFQVAVTTHSHLRTVSWTIFPRYKKTAPLIRRALQWLTHATWVSTLILSAEFSPVWERQWITIVRKCDASVRSAFFLDRCTLTGKSNVPEVAEPALCTSRVPYNPSYKELQYKNLKTQIICNLLFCDIIILFGTCCKSNTVRHASYHSNTLLYFYTLQKK